MVDLASAGNTALNIAVMIGSILIAIGAMALIGFIYIQYKKYNQFNIVIFQRDGFNQLTSKFDKGGIFVDSKTKNKRLFLRKHNVGLDPDNVPFIQNQNGKKTVYLLQTGLKNFHYINVNIKEPTITLSVGEEDVNWAINAYEKQKKLFQQSLLMQLLPFIALAFVGIIICIIFIYFFKEFATLKDMAIALKEASQIVLQSRTGAVIS